MSLYKKEYSGTAIFEYGQSRLDKKNKVDIENISLSLNTRHSAADKKNFRECRATGSRPRGGKIIKDDVNCRLIFGRSGVLWNFQAIFLDIKAHIIFLSI